MKNNITRMRTLCALLSVSLLFTVKAFAQHTTPSFDDLPTRVLDTLDTEDPNVKIIRYTNNTSSYYYSSYYYPNATEGNVEDMDRDVYNDHWKNDIIFAYMDEKLSDLPDVTELELIRNYEDFCVPLRGKVFSKYGPRKKRAHNGVDLPLKVGEPIYAAFSGKVRYSKYNNGGFGNLIIIRHENGLETWYAHLSERHVEENEYVKAGTVIGNGGGTGRVSGPHLHFEIRYRDQSFDPERIFDFQTGEIRYQTFVLEKSFFNINSRESDVLDEGDSFDDKLLVSADGEHITSEDVLHNLSEAQKRAESQQASGASSQTSADPLYYTIQKGDTLSKIARKYGTTVKTLCQLNSITETTVIRDGKRLRVR